ncbi:copper chaperone PCu(A)C [Paucibacter sp. APW11]|uniref:Copper chaperone PCu(A)C n=1 Tax=Roseateles aquae TaxID=3077235 RepID=A0ABU3PFQ0_9BURK|nr:copper chaperone PCu(A)C [Paucibacter sp. APW11]MDT9001399.1 copper chaperone PCu(A)C [Paucibacter sp. APW11]
MSKRLPCLALFSALLFSGMVQAQVQASQAWARATVAQQKATGVFLTLTAAKDARLVELSSPVAGIAEVHEMVMDGSTMKMRALPVLALQAGKPVELKPGGLHLMLMDLKRPIAAGDLVPLSLVFEDAARQRQTLELQVPARQLGTMPAVH